MRFINRIAFWRELRKTAFTVARQGGTLPNGGWHTIVKENRKFKRVHFEAPARVDCGGPQFDARVLDISLKGVLLRTPELNKPLEVGRECRIRLVLDDNPDESVPHIDMKSVIKNRHNSQPRQGGCLSSTWAMTRWSSGSWRSFGTTTNRGSSLALWAHAAAD